MSGAAHTAARKGIALLQWPLQRAFGHRLNPLNHLGALTIYFLWIVLVSGIWLLIFFRTSVIGAFDSVEYLTHEQWYLGGIMRSLHRYASDAAIITIAVHIAKEFALDRYRGPRWFTWLTGTPLIWIVFPLGISGYWLVWDELAQYVALTSSEMLDAVPVFTDSMAGNFLSDELVSDRFFTLMAFLHLIGLPIFLVFGIWLHVFRLTSPRINPPRQLMAGSFAALLVLSVVVPAVSHDKAQLAMTPQVLRLDWYYLHVYPLVQAWTPGAVWALLLGVSVTLMALPWLPKAIRQPVAQVALDYCNGCRRCADDCPYGAIEMVPRSDGKSYLHEAAVDADLCVSCGICVGACPTATPFRSRSELIPGIDLPQRTAASLRADIVAGGRDELQVLVFACTGDRRCEALRQAGIRVVTVQCMGQLPPSFVDFALHRGYAARVFLLGCDDGECQYRLGQNWTEQRVLRQRDPMLRRRIDLDQVALGWQSPWSEYADVRHAIAAFAAGDET